MVNFPVTDAFLVSCGLREDFVTTSLQFLLYEKRRNLCLSLQHDSSNAAESFVIVSGTLSDCMVDEKSNVRRSFICTCSLCMDMYLKYFDVFSSTADLSLNPTASLMQIFALTGSLIQIEFLLKVDSLASDISLTRFLESAGYALSDAKNVMGYKVQASGSYFKYLSYFTTLITPLLKDLETKVANVALRRKTDQHRDSLKEKVKASPLYNSTGYNLVSIKFANGFNVAKISNRATSLFIDSWLNNNTIEGLSSKEDFNMELFAEIYFTCFLNKADCKNGVFDFLYLPAELFSWMVEFLKTKNLYSFIDSHRSVKAPWSKDEIKLAANFINSSVFSDLENLMSAILLLQVV